MPNFITKNENFSFLYTSGCMSSWIITIFRLWVVLRRKKEGRKKVEEKGFFEIRLFRPIGAKTNKCIM